MLANFWRWLGFHVHEWGEWEQRKRLMVFNRGPSKGMTFYETYQARQCKQCKEAQEKWIA